MKKARVLIPIILTLIISAVLLVSCSNGSEAKYDSYSNNVKPGAASDGSEQVFGEKVIKNANVAAETKTFDDATESLKKLIIEYGGNIKSSNSSMKASYYSSGSVLRNADYSISIPSAKFDDFLNALNGFLNVTRVTTTTEDATEEYYDLESVVKTYRAKHDGLTEMLKNTDKDTDFSTWKQINSELTDIDVQLARYEAQLKSLEGKTTYSTVSLSLTEVGELTAVDEVGYGQEVKDAFRGSMTAVVEFFKGLLLFLIYTFPAALICGGIALTIVFSVKKSRRKARERRAALAQQQYQAQQNNANNGYTNQ